MLKYVSALRGENKDPDENNYRLLWIFYDIFFYVNPLLALPGGYFADCFGRYKTVLITLSVQSFITLVIAVIASEKLPIHEEPVLIMMFILFDTVRYLQSGALIALFGDQLEFPNKYHDFSKYHFGITFVVNMILLAFYLTAYQAIQYKSFVRRNVVSCVMTIGCLCIMVAIHRQVIEYPKTEKGLLKEMFECIREAWSLRPEGARGDDWLIHAEPSYGVKFVDNVRRLTCILVLVPMYTAVG